MTKLHLAIDNLDINNYRDTILKSKFALASYYYVKDYEFDFQSNFEHFILDSGAFSFFSKKPLEKSEMIAYCDGYADYINKFNIQNFVEIDVDSIYGYEFVLFLRDRLERKVGRKSIPIWHLSRGKNEFLKMVKEYDYAGIGGIASGEELSKHKDKFKQLNRLARKHGCRLHGMGFTPTKELIEHEFYSVDSTSWKSGRRFATTYLFKNNRIQALKKPEGKKLMNYKPMDIHNLKEWIKYQEYCYRRSIYGKVSSYRKH